MSDEGGVVLLSSSKKEREAYENYAGVQVHITKTSHVRLSPGTCPS